MSILTNFCLFVRWKEECHSIAHKFEGKIEEMREETSHLRKRNDQLTNLLKESQSKTADVIVLLLLKFYKYPCICAVLQN